ncbi:MULTISPECIES: hypothetical protein [unclassified Sphingopyxis]|uniref:hypothetical protein n=1 Tax=unclassified Sphingopyxis TaxID=2614943 RepID=UPI0007302AF5|nr:MULTISPECIES: hypothetical protein [unclassified Sphingopyxis]KTE26449.1 hypothetical protein ATE61_06840 [Sphingopyxis sp. H057]KTE52854.1 hypothetical protein ATE64_09285 [Sphingopyxis sp. H073]KTE55042.1 hypothetical protein ATE69_09260 [Sphingopyxis sp. H071]KTE62504.1 hypothetical protein ATE66_03200 [Sphingopyxis sp. H107]KTE66049.1 hypothetical protein ATE65_07770 [Sphingopyxis sp. H100]
MTEVRKTPVHLWIVGVVSLLWNAVGAFDYTMTKMQNPEYLAAFTPEQQAWFASFPLWANIGWALGVWGSVLGSLLLLARSRHAVSAFAVSLVGLAISCIYQFGLHYGDLMRLFGTFPMIFTAIIWVILIALFVYARKQAAAGVLR